MAKIEASMAGGTPITPNNDGSVTMISGEVYEPTTNGVAIASLVSATPSNSTPYTIAAGQPIKFTTAGYAVEDVYDVPANYTKTIITAPKICKFNDDSIAFNSNKYKLVTNSDFTLRYVPMTINKAYETDSYRYIVQTLHQKSPSSRNREPDTPLDDTSTYQFNSSGYAIRSYEKHTPTALGTNFTQGVTFMTTDGIAFSDHPVLEDVTYKEAVKWNGTATTFTLNGAAGDKFLLIVHTQSNGVPTISASSVNVEISAAKFSVQPNSSDNNTNFGLFAYIIEINEVGSYTISITGAGWTSRFLFKLNPYS